MILLLNGTAALYDIRCLLTSAHNTVKQLHEQAVSFSRKIFRRDEIAAAHENAHPHLRRVAVLGGLGLRQISHTPLVENLRFMPSTTACHDHVHGHALRPSELVFVHLSITCESS
jgi:hypothetical protein